MQSTFLGACDRFRRAEKGEEDWQEMMTTREEIPENQFTKVCNIYAILDEDESWEEYKREASVQGDPIKYYKSDIGLYFFQTAGFEFIWKVG